MDGVHCNCLLKEQLFKYPRAHVDYHNLNHPREFYVCYVSHPDRRVTKIGLIVAFDGAIDISLQIYNSSIICDLYKTVFFIILFRFCPHLFLRSSIQNSCLFNKNIRSSCKILVNSLNQLTYYSCTVHESPFLSILHIQQIKKNLNLRK